ncbi:MAG: ABC transporter substrate-binding protein [Acutalibacteraceae bacterium]
MKKITALLLAVVLLFLCFGCTKSDNKNNTQQTTQAEESTTQKPKAENVILIGVFESQNEDASTGAKLSIHAAKYAQYLKKSITVGKKKYKIKLDIVDAGITKESAVKAAKKLVTDKVSVVIGCRSSDALSYAADTFKNAGIAVINYVPHSVSLSGTYDNIFNLCVNDLKQAKTAAQYAYKKLKAKKAFVACQIESDTSSSLAFYFKEAFEAYGGSCNVYYFEGDTADFNELVQKAKKGKYDLFYAPVSADFADDIITECSQANASFSLMGSADWDIVSQGEETDFSIYTIDFCKMDSSDETSAAFSEWISLNDDKSAYVQSNGFTDSTALMFDAYNLALKAIKSADSKSAKVVLGKLPSIKYNGVSGTIQFNSSRINSNAVCTVSKIK